MKAETSIHFIYPYLSYTYPQINYARKRRLTKPVGHHELLGHDLLHWTKKVLDPKHFCPFVCASFLVNLFRTLFSVRFLSFIFWLVVYSTSFLPHRFSRVLFVALFSACCSPPPNFFKVWVPSTTKAKQILVGKGSHGCRSLGEFWGLRIDMDVAPIWHKNISI